MKRSLYLLALGMPLMLGAALPPHITLPPDNSSSPRTDVVKINMLDQFLQDSGIRKHQTSSKRTRSRAPAERGALPQPPALAVVPLPTPKPDRSEIAQAEAASEATSQEPAKTEPPAPSSTTPLSAAKPPETYSGTPPIRTPEPQVAQQATPKDDSKPAAAGDAKTPPVVEQPATASEPAHPAEVPTPAPKPAASDTTARDNAAAEPKPSEDDGKKGSHRTGDEKQAADAPDDSKAVGQKTDGGKADDDKASDDDANGDKNGDETAGASPPPPPLVKEDPEELKACLSDLAAIGAKFEPTDPIDDGNGCGIEHPIDVAQVLPGVELGGATMRCKTALTMAHWLKDTVQPAMNIAMPGRRITGLVPGSTYQCRLRNSAATGKISEHARGNAYDVAAFKLDNGEKIEMKPRTEDSTLEGAFQRTATAGACLHFTTVLSPGSDAAHETHLHLDVLERKGGYRYCR